MKRLAITGIFLFCVSFTITAEESKVAYEDTKLGVTFPKVIAGMTFFELEQYPDTSLGYRLQYLGPDSIVADIYVYDNGIPNIPNGYHYKLVSLELFEVVRQLKMMEQRGQYTDLKQVEGGLRPQEGVIRFAWQRFEFLSASKEGMITEIFIAGFSNKFIKLRLTYRKSSLIGGNARALQMVEELAGLIKSSKVFRKPDEVRIDLEVDGSLSELFAAPWLNYILARHNYITDHKDQYDFYPGTLAPLFEEEVMGRENLAQILKELKELYPEYKDFKDKYLDELFLVHEAGFMREYVWTYLREPFWEEPGDLKLDRFDSWRKNHLKDHSVQSHGDVFVSIKSHESDLPENL